MKALPLTQREVEVPLGHAIVCRMDAEGRITGVNADFVEVSGYPEHEVLGEYLGAECHPDVPRELLEDRWRDLAAGRPWSGVLKNRCRNGDHYWVAEQIAPVFAYGRTVGHLALRRRALRDQVAAAEALFGKFREEGARGLALRHGRPAPAGILARLAQGWRNRSLVGRLWGGVAGVLALAVFVALVGGAALSRSVAALEDAVEPRPETVAEIRAAREAAYQNRLQAARAKLAMILGVLAAAAAAIGGGIALTRRIRRPLAEARRACAAMAEGNFDARLDLARDDEPGRLLQDLARLQVCLACDASVREGRVREAAQAGEGAADSAPAASCALAGLESNAAGLEAIAFRTHILALNAVVAATRAAAEGEDLQALAAEAKALDREMADATQALRTRLAALVRSAEGAAGAEAPAEGTPPRAAAGFGPDAAAKEVAGLAPPPPAEEAALPEACAPSPAAPNSEKIAPARPSPRPRHGAPLPKVKPAGGSRRGLDKEWEEL